MDGQAAIKTGNVAGSLTGVRVAQRRTIEGSSCRLPVVYQCVDLPLSLPMTPADTSLLSQLQVKSTSWSPPACCLCAGRGNSKQHLQVATGPLDTCPALASTAK